MDPHDLPDNPRNWKLHPQEQVKTLGRLIDIVGWTSLPVFNRSTNRLLDGHARKELALKRGWKQIPVFVGEWTEEEEQLILSTHDPIGQLSEININALSSLLQGLKDQEGELQAFLTQMADDNGLYLEEDVEEFEPNVDGNEDLSVPAEEKEKRKRPTYLLSFDNEEQEETWHAWLKQLKRNHQGKATHAGRITAVISKFIQVDGDQVNQTNLNI
jgi:hypothetical protein